MSNTAGLLVGLAMLLGNAFFVGAEFAVMSARRSQIEPLAEQGNRRASVAMWAIQHMSIMLATAQFGITVCSVTLGAVAEPALAHLMEPLLTMLSIPDHLLHPISFALALLVASYLHVVFGEMIPKNISISVPVGAVLWLAGPLVFFSRIFAPIIWVLNSIANGLLRMVGIQPRDEVESEFTAEEIEAIVNESRREGLLVDDQGLLTGAIQFSAHKAKDVMVPMTDVVTVGYDVTHEQFEELVAATGFSRIGVRNDAGDLVGYLHLKDVILPAGAADDDYRSVISPGRVRAVVSVADDDDVEEALRAMQYNGAHLARVDSPEARSVGAVFLEDVLEELVGEVKDMMQNHAPAARDQ